MKVKNKYEKLTYEQYLNTLNKKDLTIILNKYHLEVKKVSTKENMVAKILENVNSIVDYTIDLFQKDECINIKYIIKKKGVLKVRINSLLLNFLQNMHRNFLLIKVDEYNYYMPNEIMASYKRILKRKNINEIIKKNTVEYELFLGYVETYGIVDYKDFYNNYAKDYKLSVDAALERTQNFADFFNEFMIITKEKSTYLMNINLDFPKALKKLNNKKIELAKYTNEEIINIHRLDFLKKCKSYRKLLKFVKRNYEVKNENSKIFNKRILIPYFTARQIDKNMADVMLSALIDKYFEFNNVKFKNKFIKLIYDVSLDYPRWDLKGNLERNIVC